LLLGFLKLSLGDLKLLLGLLELLLGLLELLLGLLELLQTVEQEAEESREIEPPFLKIALELFESIHVKRRRIPNAGQPVID